MRLLDLLLRRRPRRDDPLDSELENLFLRSSRVPIPEQRELMRARSRVGNALAQGAPVGGRLRGRLAAAAAVTGGWRPALGGAAAVAVLMLTVAFAALASTSDRASADFEEEVSELAATTEAALADGEFDDNERDDVSGRIASLVAELEAAPETLTALDIEALGAVAEDLSDVQEALAGLDGEVEEAASGLSSLVVSVAEATVSEASSLCDDAETRDGMEGCREAFHAAAGACDELGDAREDCLEAVELAKDEAETLYEARKLEAESAAGCEDVASLDSELGAACEEIVEGVGEACDGEEFARCREAFHEAKAACEELGELAYQGCKSAAEALKDAAEAGDDDGTESIDPAIAELRAAFEAAQSCAELPDGALAAGCQSAIDELTEACSDVRVDGQRDECREVFHDLLDAFHEGKQACAAFGAASDACIDALERVKDAAAHDVKDAAEHDYEELKKDAEQARSCGDVATLDPDAGAACSAVATTVAEACIAGGAACRVALHEARDACKALGPLAAEGCMSEVDAIKNSAEKDEESAEKLSSAGEGEGNGVGRGRGSPEKGGRGGSD